MYKREQRNTYKKKKKERKIISNPTKNLQNYLTFIQNNFQLKSLLADSNENSFQLQTRSTLYTLQLL